MTSSNQDMVSENHNVQNWGSCTKTRLHWLGRLLPIARAKIEGVVTAKIKRENRLKIKLNQTRKIFSPLDPEILLCWASSQATLFSHCDCRRLSPPWSPWLCSSSSSAHQYQQTADRQTELRPGRSTRSTPQEVTLGQFLSEKNKRAWTKLQDILIKTCVHHFFKAEASERSRVSYLLRSDGVRPAGHNLATQQQRPEGEHRARAVQSFQELPFADDSCKNLNCAALSSQNTKS